MIEIFQYGFMIRAFIAGGVISIIAPIIGNFLIIKRYSLFADALSHIALVGIAIGVLLGGYPLVTALIISIAASILIEVLRERQKLFGEIVLSIFLSASLALTALLISAAKGMNVNFLNYLFGSITTVSQEDVLTIVTMSIIVIILIFLFFKELFFVSFDEELAKANGLPVRVINILLMVVTSITITLALRIVGGLLIGALMIIPVITASQLSRSFKNNIFLSIFFSTLAVIIGLLLSYYFDLSSGGTIVICSIIFLLITFFVLKKE